ncbi:hypothetical protein BLNAU_9356 [Blattamonas nauphoetae]|uniref:Uncharacterized protein n=1 Tax=Blattamonas nauphoetae TaxID=2049346 RepID=A0ABQ9XW22_9EUKA|nr:hypothetical protein BLNAU_9356 [Blattamonas nauphoetae]
MFDEVGMFEVKNKGYVKDYSLFIFLQDMLKQAATIVPSVFIIISIRPFLLTTFLRILLSDDLPSACSTAGTNAGDRFGQDWRGMVDEAQTLVKSNQLLSPLINFFLVHPMNESQDNLAPVCEEPQPPSFIFGDQVQDSEMASLEAEKLVTILKDL